MRMLKSGEVVRKGDEALNIAGKWVPADLSVGTKVLDYNVGNFRRPTEDEPNAEACKEDIQSELDMTATQLVKTLNERNALGTQLDLVRDELLRIQARILETGLLDEHPGLRAIFDYCQRAQKDIEVNYTPIMERDAAKKELARVSGLYETAVEELKRKAEVCKWRFYQAKEYHRPTCTPIPFNIDLDDHENFRFCPFCGRKIEVTK